MWLLSRRGAKPWGAFALLALWPSTIVADKTAADYYVRDLPGLPKDATPIKMHAGHIEVMPEHNGNLFFWHFQNKHIADRQRTVIWLNGGPGCSSEDGALMEVGPYRVQKDETLALNNGSWHEFANLLFVDNPVGTGFSYVDTDSFIHELTTMSEQFIVFLDKFFSIFPEYAHDDLYIAGESFAGQYIPYVGKAILDRNSKATQSEQWSLRGLLIGNGWISPEDQRDSYLKYSLQKGIVEEGSTEAMALADMQQKCDVALATDPDHVSYRECDAILQRIMDFTKTADNKCVNVYDVRLTDTFPSCGMNWPPDLAYVGPYLRRMDVIGALNLNRQRNAGWEECNSNVGNNFRNLNSTPSVHLLPEILAQVPVLLFSGAEDLICNHLGTEAIINNLEWNGGKGFEVTPGNWAPRRDWTFEGESAGFWQEARNLTYVQFYDASHMVPFDYPRRSRDMLDRFMRVDISDIGGLPSDSRIDGEKGPDTSVGDATNNTQSHQEEAKKKLAQAKWEAYQRSGEVVLVIVIIAATAWGYFVWRQRRKGAVYAALRGEAGASRSGSGLVAFNRRHGDRDLEAEAFDETTIDSIPLQSSIHDDHHHYSVGDDSDDEGYEKPDGDNKSAK